jgi:hypothetical protein
MSKNKTKQKQQPKPTLVAFLLDRTGSMDCCKEETIKGFNGYIAGLRKQKDECIFTLTQFDTQGIDVIHDGVALSKVSPLTQSSYQPRGSTNLYDAMATTMEAAQGKAGGKYKVLFVTLTDGQENASVRFNKDAVQKMIKEREDQDHWTFAHIGVGIDGFGAGQSIMQGSKSFANNVRYSHKDQAAALQRLANCTNTYRSSISTQCCVDTDFYKKDVDTPEEAA